VIRFHLRRGIGLCTLAVFGVWACGAPAGDALRPADTASASGAEPGQEAEEVDPDLVGLWRGYWSPKGCVRTESHLLLPDGRWRWRATYPETERGSDRVAERSGSWSRRGSVLVLVEQEYREMMGCPGEAGGEVPDGEVAAATACDEPRYREVRHPSPVVKELVLGECPPNRDAETLDATYFCRSIGGQAFWRQAIPGEKGAAPAGE
jgi:hypothetical protein